MEKKRKILPAVYLGICLVSLWLLQLYAPVQQLVDPPLAYAGVLLVLSGIFMAAISANMFVKADTVCASILAGLEYGRTHFVYWIVAVI